MIEVTAAKVSHHTTLLQGHLQSGDRTWLGDRGIYQPIVRVFKGMSMRRVGREKLVNIFSGHVSVEENIVMLQIGVHNTATVCMGDASK